MKLLIFVIILVAVLLLSAFGGKKTSSKVYGSPVYADLCRFTHWAQVCERTNENFLTIHDRLQIDRARPEMEDVVFNDKVNELTKTFESKFIQL